MGKQRYIAAFTRVFERYSRARRNNFAVQSAQRSRQHDHTTTNLALPNLARPALQANTTTTPAIPRPCSFLTTPAGTGPATNMTTPLEWKPLWDAMDATPTEWIETTEQMYWDMLEALPPRAQSGGRFLVGEPLRHVDGQAVHACFWEREDGTYWARNLTVAEFRGVAP